MLRYCALRLLEALTALAIMLAFGLLVISTTEPASPATPQKVFIEPPHPPADEVFCTAHAIYHEARGEPFLGQVAVAHVIKNRAANQRWPGHACKVVYQPKQFTDIQQTTPDFESKEWREALRIAIVVLADLDEDPTSGATHYFAHNKIDPPWWSKEKPVTARINNHTFLGDN